jgi:tRNA-splicing endonuclease subunit Sen2
MASTMESSTALASPETILEDVRQPKPQRPRKPNYNYIHRNLLPLEVHPLPVLIPHNPLSLLAIALSYLTQIISPPQQQPICKAYFSSATSSIHVTDHVSARKLWEMGFFGKGSLSRSEPTWLESQRKKGDTSEEATHKRRDERRQIKLERAKKEQEAIEVKLREEGSVNSSTLKINTQRLAGITSVMESGSATPDDAINSNGSIHGYDEWKNSVEANGVLTPPPTSNSSEASLINSQAAKKQIRIKSVRFSPTIEAREFDLTSPIISPIKNPGPLPLSEQVPTLVPTTGNQEHLQLSQEEAFFLVYSLGKLKVYADDSDIVLPASSLLSLFRRYSYAPPRSLSVPAEPDDPFMLSYAVYHHYRSLGWVVRSGVKFAVDYLLYNRGPAFSHAEFAVMVLPSYSHSYWSATVENQQAVQARTGKSWWWLHCVNRVQSQVKKNLLLCYVDIPPPLEEHEKFVQDDIGKLLARYKVRDMSIKRWIPNRSRD